MADISAYYVRREKSLDIKYIFRLIEEIKNGWQKLPAIR
jgi:hypothetical protein